MVYSRLLRTHAFKVLPRIHVGFQARTVVSSSSLPPKRRFRRVVLLTTGATLTGSLLYYLSRDPDFVEEAEGAHEHLHPLAVHPKPGGIKNLPVVEHQLDERDQEQRKERLVIVGGGWAAVSILKSLEKDKYNVTVISNNNYFLFTPLLPSATVGTLEMRSLLEPLRKIVSRVKGHFLEAEAIDVDLDNKLVEVKGITESDNFYVPYDKLVVAVGATSITHGINGIEHTASLKTIRDAINIRRQVTDNVEKACYPTTTPEERKKLLSFVICGGGPTGVEFAAELFDWVNEDLVKWFPKVIRERVSITIIQSRDHILNTFDAKISEYAERRFNREKINVITNARVMRVDEDKVIYRYKDNGEDKYGEIPFGLCLWSTGIAMSPFAEMLTKKLNSQAHKRALRTDGFLRLKGVNDIFALGDCASIENPKLITHIMEIFEQADENHDGSLTKEEFKGAIAFMRKRFPLTEEHLTNLERLFSKYDFDKSGTLELEEMESMLKDIDSTMTDLPATAQVASQQGQYLGKYLSRLADVNSDESEVSRHVGPFHYRHFGTLAYLGNTAVGEFSKGYKMVGGLWALYLWRSVYWSEQVSMRTRMNLSLDWSKRALWGRDLSSV
ncbi:hypothetical protein EC973_009428 [Apophysomyces ossiformis]|uniref:EF-hand domain-containing protein n=1 Tax=Apophysomyces ossiformis TaxID=679940 RepID=A0A8H7EPL4_9FUNG|nr:hypothetical protein EC973_009428 [Apophysomyces ossiformis]